MHPPRFWQDGHHQLDQYGRGEYHEDTGLWDWYETPREVLTAGTPVTYLSIFEQWPLVEGSFQAVFGIDLERVWRRKSWRWFAVRITYLLQTDTALNRFFRPDEEPDQKPELPDEFRQPDY